MQYNHDNSSSWTVNGTTMWSNYVNQQSMFDGTTLNRNISQGLVSAIDGTVESIHTQFSQRIFVDPQSPQAIINTPLFKTFIYFVRDTDDMRSNVIIAGNEHTVLGFPFNNSIDDAQMETYPRAYLCKYRDFAYAHRWKLALGFLPIIFIARIKNWISAETCGYLVDFWMLYFQYLCLNKES